MARTKTQIINTCVEAILELFPNHVRANFKWAGQTFEERADGWVRSVIDELQTELDGGEDFPDEDDDDDDDSRTNDEGRTPAFNSRSIRLE